MPRYSSGRWSRPATGRQIAALKAHGNYDGKYYSLGRASQVIGKSIASGSPSSAGKSRGGSLRTSSTSRGYSVDRTFSTRPIGNPQTTDSLTSLVADLLGVPATMDELVRRALSQDPPMKSAVVDPVESVVFALSTDETDPENPLIQIESVVSRDPNFDGEIELGIQFRSNVEFGDVPQVPLSGGFTSGVEFDA